MNKRQKAAWRRKMKWVRHVYTNAAYNHSMPLRFIARHARSLGDHHD
jgi:hypothetical protein